MSEIDSLLFGDTRHVEAEPQPRNLTDADAVERLLADDPDAPEPDDLVPGDDDPAAVGPVERVEPAASGPSAHAAPAAPSVAPGEPAADGRADG